MADIVITGGLVVTPNGADNLDVFIMGESISAVAAPGSMDHGDARVIDATGKIVVPGGVEPHAHIGGPRQPERSGAIGFDLAHLPPIVAPEPSGTWSPYYYVWQCVTLWDISYLTAGERTPLDAPQAARPPTCDE